MWQNLWNVSFFKVAFRFFFSRGWDDTRAINFTRGLVPPNHRDAFKNLTSSSQPLALPWLLEMQTCFLRKVEHIPVKPRRHLQGLVSITTSRTVSLRALTVATSESTRIFCVQIAAPYLYRCFLCLLELTPSPHIVHSCPVQLQVGSLQPLEAGSAHLGMGRGFISPSSHRELESMWRTIWALSQRAEGQPAWECGLI